MRTRTLAALLVLACAALVAACGAGGPGSGSRPVVVATTTQLGDVVRAVGGDAVDVHQVLQPNTDPHEYEPRPNDAKAAATAVLVIASGDGLDGWVSELASQAGDDTILTIAPAHTPFRIAADAQERKHGRFDPHWWHDPRNVVFAVGRIRAALVAAAPADRRAAIARDADAYIKQVRALDRGIATCMDAIRPAQRKLVTDHDAFGYFAERYGIDVVGAVIPSQTTQAQPSAGDLADLTDTIRREHVKAVFPESSLNPKLADAIARETGASADHELYGDTLGPAGSRGATYLGMEAANADAMVRGFSGDARGCAIAGVPGAGIG
jgi:zinc/manganese transport system substrate-binding protein